MADLVRLEVADAVATVTLDRPHARNALNRQMLGELTDVLVGTEQRHDIAVVIITGAGTAFCAGLDLSELSAPGMLDLGELTGRRPPWPEHDKPWIGAVNGAAITGGLELALACDFIVASDRAKFADTHARVGILPFWGLTAALPQAVGVRSARLMSLTGNFVDAREALDWGLVSRVVAHDQLIPVATQLAHDIVTNDQAAARAIAAAHRDSWGHTASQAMEIERQRALDWQGTNFDAALIARRIAAVKSRGREQA